jgi:hypothetical protein
MSNLKGLKDIATVGSGSKDAADVRLFFVSFLSLDPFRDGKKRAFVQPSSNSAQWRILYIES